MRESRENGGENVVGGKKKAPVSRGCVEVGFFVVGKTDARLKGHVVPAGKISFFAARRFSGTRSPTASDVDRGKLRRVGGEDHGPLQDVG